MALGNPTTGTGSIPSWFSQYETDISALLQRLADNTANEIDAKDVRDAIWTLYNQVQIVASSSLTQSFSYTLATPSTIDVGGISEGSTFTNVSFQDFLDQLLLPYVLPVVDSLFLSNTELEFGQTTPTSVNFNINVGSSPLLGNITFVSPNPSTPINPYPTTGSDPEIGSSTNNFTPTFSSTASLVEYNIVTMNFQTADSLTFSATASLIFKHKKYYGPVNLTSLGLTNGWWNLTSSVASVSSLINDATILGLSFSQLSIDFDFSQEMYFGTGSHFVFAHPTIFGDLPQDGFYVENGFSSGFSKVRSGVTFSNFYSYNTPYDVWVSYWPFNDSIIKLNT
jgi:hypothetical protein